MSAWTVAELDQLDPEAMKFLRSELTVGVSASTAEFLALDMLFEHIGTHCTDEDARNLVDQIMNELRGAS